jgi:hypothetical protein
VEKPPSGPADVPLARKVGIKVGHRVLLWDAPPAWAVQDLPEGVTVTTSAPKADIVLAFFVRAGDLAAEIGALARAIMPDGSLWVAWPRRAAGHTSDITDNVVRGIVLPLGLVDVKVAALDHDWSGLKIVWRKERRQPAPTATG